MNYITYNPNLDRKTIFIMNIILQERSNGKSRRECARIANIKNQRIQHWYNEGKNGFGEENMLFYKHLKSIEEELLTKQYAKDIKEYNKPTNSTKRRQYINNIKQGQTRKEASKNASIDLKLPDRWYVLGKKGIKPFTKFLSEYNKAREQANLITKPKEGIFKPLPQKWKEYFENKPMNKTGIAWVSEMGKNYVYQRQSSNKHIRIADPDIYELYTKVIKKNYVWGIRDITRARKIIKKTVPSPKDKITVKYIRLGKTKVKIKINGTVNQKEIKKIFEKLEFFELDMAERHETKINNKTKINIEYEINISLLNIFENTIKEFGWKILK